MVEVADGEEPEEAEDEAAGVQPECFAEHGLARCWVSRDSYFFYELFVEALGVRCRGLAVAGTRVHQFIDGKLEGCCNGEAHAVGHVPGH